MSSYADIAAKGPKQTPEEAAAPQPPQIVPNESASTSVGSLIDVDTQSVRSVPSNFMEQSIQTDTQADRVEREEEAKDNAKTKAKEARDKAAAKARKADNWITQKLAALTEGESTALVASNAIVVLGIVGFLGYKAYGLYTKGRLDVKTVGIGATIVGAVGIGQGVFVQYFAKARGKGKQQ